MDKDVYKRQVLSFVDGKTIKCMTSAQDHKRALDGDQGLNTGGMGTFSPSPFYTEEVDKFCKDHIYQATVDAMRAEGREFKGCLLYTSVPSSTICTVAPVTLTPRFKASSCTFRP